LLTTAVLDDAAQLFGIHRPWLENTTDRIYDTYTCYRQPEALFNQLSRLKYEMHSCPLRALTSSKSLNFRNDSRQSLVLVVVEKLAKEEDVDKIWTLTAITSLVTVGTGRIRRAEFNLKQWFGSLAM